MVTLFTNRSEYTNDIAEVIRVFWGFVEIFPGAYDDVPGCAVEVLLEGGAAHARVKKDGAEHTAQCAVAGQAKSALHQKRWEKRAVKTAVYRVMRALEKDISLPWGALTGIRPTKLYRELVETEGEDEALRLFLGDFDVHPEKAALIRCIADVQQPLIARLHERDMDVYIGIPYCRTRCLYCSFASELAGKNGVPEEYLRALLRDIELGARTAKEGGYRVRAMYVGGGTPTVLSADALNRLLDWAITCYGGFGEELTVEAGRPDTVDDEKLRALKAAGVTRISLNPQSMRINTLTRIGREHTPEDIVGAYRLAREAGFSCINMDVIAGLPGETPEDMAYTLNELVRLAPDNLTVHTLAVKRSSRLKESLDAYPLPSPADAAHMAALGANAAQALDMRPYYMYRQKYMRGNLENVGYAKAGLECLYNVDMMEEAASIFAHGAGAMTKRVFHARDMRVERVPAPKDIATYIRNMEHLCAKKHALFME